MPFWLTHTVPYRAPYCVLLMHIHCALPLPVWYPPDPPTLCPHVLFTVPSWPLYCVLLTLLYCAFLAPLYCVLLTPLYCALLTPILCNGWLLLLYHFKPCTVPNWPLYYAFIILCTVLCWPLYCAMLTPELCPSVLYFLDPLYCAMRYPTPLRFMACFPFC